jgi:hypothetical protein
MIDWDKAFRGNGSGMTNRRIQAVERACVARLPHCIGKWRVDRHACVKPPQGWTVIYEGAQFVKGVPEAPLDFRRAQTTGDLDRWARQCGPSGEPRTVESSHLPAGGRRRGSLDGSVSCSSHHNAKPVRASWSSPCDAVSGTRCGPSPEPTKVGGGHPKTRGPVIYSSREATWSGSAATWWAQSLTRSRRRTGTLTVGELAPGCVRPGSHPVSARQRISPSRRP